MEYSGIEAILWDFDGVLLNSNEIRNLGFELVLKDYPKDQVDQLMTFHKNNGGLSRYVKFRYFFEEILKEEVSDETIIHLASAFSKVMMEHLCNESLLIGETISFVKLRSNLMAMYIVSGSDQKELRELCNYFGISEFFKGIYGSPTPKKSLVSSILVNGNYNPQKCLLIGDSINDFDAATVNGIHFMAYNNDELREKTTLGIPLN